MRRFYKTRNCCRRLDDLFYLHYHDIMYLSGSKWSMTRRKKRGNPFRIIVLVALIAGAIYVNQFIVPVTPPLFVPTPTPTRSPDSFVLEAQDFVNQGKYDQAVASYEQAIKSAPQNVNLYLDLARLEILYGDYEPAMENIQNALLLNANNSLANAVKGWALGRMGDFPASAAALSTALEIDPGNALAYAYQAEILAQQIIAGKGDLNSQDKAIAASRRALELGTGQLEVHRARGLVLEVTGNYKDAIDEFKKALTINDKLSDLHVALGRNYKADQQIDSAFEEFNRAIALNPTDPQPYIEVALIYLNQGDYAKAAQNAEAAIQQKSDDPLLYGYLGTILYRSQNYTAAVQPLRLATRGGSVDNGAGQLVQVQGLALDGDTLAMYARYGLSLARTGNCGEALQISQTLMQAFPDDETNLFNAGEMVNICSGISPTPTPASTP
jgi:tetratricopeptide (TPR) repeat protein